MPKAVGPGLTWPASWVVAALRQRFSERYCRRQRSSGERSSPSATPAFLRPWASEMERIVRPRAERGTHPARERAIVT